MAVIDPKAVQHILLHQAKHFPKPADEIRTVGLTTGPGLLVVEGDAHRLQRKILTPAFTQAQVMSYFPIFTAQARKVRQLLSILILRELLLTGELLRQLVVCLESISEFGKDDWSSTNCSSNAYTRINVSDWLTRVTMDIVGSSGFGHNIGALDNQDHALVDAFARMLTPFKMNAILFLGIQFIAKFTWIAKIPVPIPGVRLAQRSLSLMKQCAREMLDSKQDELKLGQLEDEKDILSCIIKANKLATSEKERLTDEEVRNASFDEGRLGPSLQLFQLLTSRNFQLVSSVATFLLLGHETSGENKLMLLPTRI